MKRFGIGILTTILLLPNVLAFIGNYGVMGGYSSVGYLGMSILGLLWLALATFVFSAIFWYTYKLIVKKDEIKKR